MQPTISPDENSEPPVAMVTGATRGIGRAIAICLASAGYDVAFCYRQSADAAKALEESIRALGRRASGKVCDVQDFAAVKDWMREVEKDFGGVQVLVNNAGMTNDKPLVMMTEEDFASVVNVNLSSTFNVCRCAIFNMMKRQTGCIINISSIAGVWGNAGQSNYSAAKAGIIGFSNALAKEVGRFGIRVNVVAPGPIKTDMADKLPPEQLQSYIDRTPLGRLGQPEEVGHLVTFLASPQASFITAQTICIDGGIRI